MSVTENIDRTNAGEKAQNYDYSKYFEENRMLRAMHCVTGFYFTDDAVVYHFFIEKSGRPHFQ